MFYEYNIFFQKKLKKKFAKIRKTFKKKIVLRF